MHPNPVRILKLSLWILLGAAMQIQAQSPPTSAVIVSVEGIEDAAGYAAVTGWLESAVSLQGLSVEDVSGTTVVYRVRTPGDPQQLAAVLGAHTQLQPLPDANPNSLKFRYRP